MDLKKLTFRMDKADGESRTVIVIASTPSIVGNYIRTKFAHPIVIHSDESLTLIKEETISNPKIVGTKPDFIFIDDFTELEEQVHANLCEIGLPEPILDKPEPCWSQGDRTYGKKNRRFKR
ncbi:hypothetical protein PP761_gp10 [Stenotrophomonas phage Paxi]|uniref:Uncharacterized protein n=1 Tax=Stenotrophomonas phage Paxi TaxID=2859653 RepID=A0AAE8BJ75_9CAUD|nr:hypothetical protein PP761_gp10 [Stenotrophomonas phage Paxi]QYW01781.1 hypothetical protein CPT_Paxi_010 [Stenotrophomonas phage Paxi]